MSSDLVSRKTRLELREYYVSTTLSTISDEFDSADILCDASFQPSVSGQRRGLVEQYYASIDWKKWADVRKFITLYENTLSNRLICRSWNVR